MKRIIILLYLLFLSQLVHAQPGYLDKTFGDGGVVTIKSNDGYFSPLDIIVLPDGKILQYGFFSDHTMYLMKHDRYGAVDSTFGINGLSTISLLNEGFPMKLFIPDGGRIFVYNGYPGPFHNPGTTTIICFTPDGHIDSSFAVNGIYEDTSFSRALNFTELMIDSTNNLIALGTQFNNNNTYGTYRPTITRITPNGKKDSTFGKDGSLVAGSVSDTGGIYEAAFYGKQNYLFSYEMCIYETGSQLLRTDLNGVPDSTFGDNGIFRKRISDGCDYISSIMVNNTGSILCDVRVASRDGNMSVLMRLLQDGSIDQSFGDRGFTEPFNFALGNSLYFSLLDSSQCIIKVAPVVDSIGSNTFIMTRYNSNGRIDSSFGVNGISNCIPSQMREISSIVVQPDGKYILLGYNNDDFGRIYAVMCRVENGSVSGVQIEDVVRLSLSLHPTPSTDNCTLTYTLPASSECSITLRDESGRGVRAFATNQHRIAGKHEEELDLRGLAAGVYFLQIESGGATQTAKLIKQ